MDNLYEVVEIPGKGLGCKALQDIKMGTLILKEKPQCVGQKEIDFSYAFFESQINSFNSMSQQNKDEFLKLSNAFRNPKSIPTALENCYSAFKKFVGKYMAKHPKADKKSILDIICIYSTNIWMNKHGNSVKIKASRFNHSCRSNAGAVHCLDDVHELEIRAVSNIKIGEEICINYQPIHLGMKNLKARRQFLTTNANFKCCCELCDEEDLRSDDEIYEKFRKLQEEAERFKRKLREPGSQMSDPEMCEKIISVCKQMYQLAKNKKAPRIFILDNLKIGFDAGLQGYQLAKYKRDSVKTQYFKEESQKITKVGEQIAKILYGKDHPNPQEWKKMQLLFEQI